MAPRRPAPRTPTGHQGRQARIQRSRVMDKASPSTFVGIDVAKLRLDLHSRPSGESSTIDYDDENVAALVERLAALAPALVVLEATGGQGGRPAAPPAAARESPPADEGGETGAARVERLAAPARALVVLGAPGGLEVRLAASLAA